ncbi:MAG TPA: hypothetical protein VJI96_01690 [Candidatus Andersenbacteria bacterium]|nr:hypothetical protein [Candidatus Andersenbacteria bacterium]
MQTKIKPTISIDRIPLLILFFEVRSYQLKTFAVSFTRSPFKPVKPTASNGCK